MKSCDFLSNLYWLYRASLTNDNGLRFTLDSDSCARASSHFHPVHNSDLEPAHHHRANGCIHRLVNMEAGLITETPDLQQTGQKIFSSSYMRKSTDLLRQTLYSWIIPFWWSGGGGSQEMLMEVLFWFPTVRTVTC